jgi:hypothetical protein
MNKAVPTTIPSTSILATDMHKKHLSLNAMEKGAILNSFLLRPEIQVSI